MSLEFSVLLDSKELLQKTMRRVDGTQEPT